MSTTPTSTATPNSQVTPANEKYKATPAHCLRALRNFTVTEKNTLNVFYPDDASLTPVADIASAMVNTLQDRGCTFEKAMQFSVLTLYDLVVLLDDSDTISLAEEGKRLETLKTVMNEVAEIYTLARPKAEDGNPGGIKSVRFFNTRQGKGNVTPEKAKTMLDNLAYTGLTKIGTELRRKILDPFLYKAPEALKKPLLIMIITDGDIEGEDEGLLRKEINNCIAKLEAKDFPKGKHAAAFFFSRVGDDNKAKDLIEGLDNDPALGPWIDCFPVNERLEEITSTDPKKRWAVLQKLLLGALYGNLDKLDKPEEPNKEEIALVEAKPQTDDEELPEDD